MDERIKNEWIAALTSGNYRQGNERLRWYDWEDSDAGESFCCLGVLCDVINPNGWNDSAGHWDVGSFCHTDSYAPEAFLDLKIQEKLATFNDDESWTFDMIAEWIGENL